MAKARILFKCKFVKIIAKRQLALIIIIPRPKEVFSRCEDVAIDRNIRDYLELGSHLRGVYPTQ